MQFRVTMKTPDALDEAIEASVPDDTAAESVRALCSQWFRYGEVITLEIDTNAATCVVIPSRT